MTDQTRRILIRWAESNNAVWNDLYPLSHAEKLRLDVCSKCGAEVDFLILQSHVSEQGVQQALDEVAEWIGDTSACVGATGLISGRSRLTLVACQPP